MPPDDARLTVSLGDSAGRSPDARKFHAQRVRVDCRLGLSGQGGAMAPKGIAICMGQPGWRSECPPKAMENIAVKIIGLLTLYVLLSAPAWGQTAPFCVVSQTGQQSCFYHSLDACRQAAASMNGACAANGRREAPAFYDTNKAIQQPDIAGSFQRGQAEGQRLRLERERHQAEMAVLAAQTEALKAKRQQPTTGNGYWVRYKCLDENGNWQPSFVPVPGCVVDSVTAY